ncbi:MAG: hypothetical protein IPM29_18675 [Planctomycetes bacterium]|nr:hypothetical protein [Planctomycetota bacterium]
MATPSPDREIKRLEAALKAEPLPQVVVLGGASRFFRDEAFELVVAALPADAELRRVDGSEAGDGRELDDLLGGGLFGSGSWVLVRRAEKWLDAHGAELAARLPRIAPGCGLVLELTKLDRRTKLAKTLAELAQWFEFRDLYAEPYDRSRSPLEAELCRFIESRARTLGLRITPEAAFLVQSTVGTDPAELVAELARLRDAVGDPRRTLGPDDLRSALHVGFESTPFELAEAVLAGDRARAMRSLDAMFERGVRTKDGAGMEAGGVFPFVASWLWQAFSQAHAGRRLLDSGVRAEDVPGRVGVRAFTERFRAQIEQNPAARLRHGQRLLLRAQRELRSSGEEPRWILDRFLMRYFAGQGGAVPTGGGGRRRP